jgi:hypothetical protein
MRRRWLVVVLASAAACQAGAGGEGPGFTGRVVSVTSEQVCVGPNTSRDSITCGTVPNGPTDLPRVGQCVSLFAHLRDGGNKLDWTASSLRATVADTKCTDR